MSTGVATYYDRLGRWNRLARVMGYGGGSESHTVHRALADPAAGGRPTYTRLHDLIVEQLRDLRQPRVLDAGCGLGGTMLALADALGATCTGITLSGSQADVANAVAARTGRTHSVRAVVQSYDTPPDGPFDLIVAIESLAHSEDPSRSLSALAGVLAPGGHIVIVDDMPEDPSIGTRDLARFKAGWRCPVLWSAREYRDAIAREALEIVADVDLTPDVRPRSASRLALLTAANRLVALVPFPGLRQVMDSHLGGLALERLIRDGGMRYRLLVARKAALQVS